MKILITGANRGLGLTLARMGAERGHTILAGVRNVDNGTQRLSQLQSEFPESIFIYSLDVTNEASIAQTASMVEQEHGSVDGIINNAGILLGREQSIEELDMEQVQTTFEVNVYGPMRVVKHFLPLLYQGSSPSIINISSEAGSFENAYGGDYPYAMSKAALNMFSEQLRDYVKKHDIQVYSVHPGWIRTDMGGEKAPGDPQDTAKGILDIVERRVQVTSQYAFVDYQGKPMPI